MKRPISTSSSKNLINKFKLVLAVSIVVPILGFYANQKFLKSEESTSARFWGVCIKKWNPNGSLRTMEIVFKNLGYHFVTPSSIDDFDVLWSIENPFTAISMKKEIYRPLIDAKFKLKSHQKINHFPGIYLLTNKGSLCTNTQTKYLLPTFVFPYDKEKFEIFIQNNPKVKFVEKNEGNRGVRVIELNQIIYEDSQKIYQEFLYDPFLIDGHAFDFGVYVLITSINPLRIFRYAGENFIRFCPDRYHPFNHRKRGKYVVDENHLAAYEIESFREGYLNYSFSFKTIFENIIKKRGFDVEKFWSQIDDAITSLILSKEEKISYEIKNLLNSTRNLFELVRFDFVFRKDLSPIVMEINMSPNLTPSGNKEEFHYSLIYEQLIYNTLQLVGAGSLYDLKSRVNDDTIISNDKNIATNYEVCKKIECELNCDDPRCHLCLPCVDAITKTYMHDSYQEHSKQGNFKRIFPSIFISNDTKLLIQNQRDVNKLMIKWFAAKCEENQSWC